MFLNFNEFAIVNLNSFGKISIKLRYFLLITTIFIAFHHKIAYSKYWAWYTSNSYRLVSRVLEITRPSHYWNGRGRCYLVTPDFDSCLRTLNDSWCQNECHISKIWSFSCRMSRIVTEFSKISVFEFRRARPGKTTTVRCPSDPPDSLPLRCHI